MYAAMKYAGKWEPCPAYEASANETFRKLHVAISRQSTTDVMRTVLSFV
jgi:hypothetical protein